MSTADHLLSGAKAPSAASVRAPSHGEHLPALDGLRALSVLVVMISHAGLGRVVPGGLGVTIFFFISGFLITRLLLAEHAGAARIDFLNFYSRRFLRLGPALVTYVLIAGAALLAVGGFHLRDIAASLFYYANYYQIYWGFAHAVAQTPGGEAVQLQSPFSILWSLAIEEHFYLLFPLLLAALASNLKRALWIFGAALIAVLAWRCVLVFAADADTTRTYMGTDTRIDSILHGVVTAIAARLFGARFANRSMFALISFGFGGALMLASLLFRDPAFRETFRYSLQGIALVPIVAGLVFAPSLALPRRVLELKPIVYLGKLSYSLYLYHYLAAMLATWVCAINGLATYGLVWQLAFVGLTLPAAMASYHLIEQPFLKLRRRFGSVA